MAQLKTLKVEGKSQLDGNTKVSTLTGASDKLKYNNKELAFVEDVTKVSNDLSSELANTNEALETYKSENAIAIGKIKNTADSAIQSATFAGKEMAKSGTKLEIAQADARTALGLGTAAYTDKEAYDTAGSAKAVEGQLNAYKDENAQAIASVKETADSAIQSATFAGAEMAKSGTNLNITQTEARTALGLGSAAYTNSNTYDTAGSAAAVQSQLETYKISNAAAIYNINTEIGKVKETAEDAKEAIDAFLKDAEATGDAIDTLIEIQNQLNAGEASAASMLSEIKQIKDGTTVVPKATHAETSEIATTAIDTLTTNASQTNGNVYLITKKQTNATDSVKIKGVDGIKVTTDANSAINIAHTNNVTGATISGSSGTIDSAGSINIPQITYDAQGHITSTGTTKITLPNSTYSLTKSADGTEIILKRGTDEISKVVDAASSVSNHYTPEADTNSQLSVDASSTTAATWGGTDLVTGVNIQRDAKGHVTGVTVDSIQMPANPDTNTTYSINKTSKGVISLKNINTNDLQEIVTVYPAEDCKTFTSDSGTVTPLAVQKGAEFFAITRPPKRAANNPANPGTAGTCTTNNIVRWLNAAGDVQDSNIKIEDVTNTKDSSKKAQVITIPAEGGKKMVYGYCTDQVDGTSFIGGVFPEDATSYPYASGLAIGGTSGNLLWKGKQVVTMNDIAGADTLGVVRGFHRTSGKATGTKTTTASNAPAINARSTTSGRYYGVETDASGYMFVNVPWTNVNSSYLPKSGGDISGHIYLTGSQASSSTGNTSQIVFGTSSSNHIAISSNNHALVLNPTTSTTANQIVLYLDKASVFPSGISANVTGNLTGTASKATADGSGNNIVNTYVPKSGTTMTGALKAQNNANYTTSQMRNISYYKEGTSLPSASTSLNGDMIVIYEE